MVDYSECISFYGCNKNNEKADPVITWENPTDINYGTTLGDVQLNATANTDGTFVYTPAAGTVLEIGEPQT